MTETVSHRSPPTATAGESACAYRVLRYTPNLVRDEWVNIGILLFNPATGERLACASSKTKRNTAACAACIPTPMSRCCARCATISKTASRPPVRQAPANCMVRTAAAPGSNCWPNGTTRCPTPCNLRRKKASSPPTSTSNSSVSMPITSRYRLRPAASVYPAAAPGCAPTARRFSVRPISGAHRKIGARRTMDPAGRSPAPRLQLPPQRHARLRAHPLRHPRARRFQAAGLHRRAHPRQGKLKTEFAAVTDVPWAPRKQGDVFGGPGWGRWARSPAPRRGCGVGRQA